MARTDVPFVYTVHGNGKSAEHNYCIFHFICDNSEQDSLKLISHDSNTFKLCNAVYFYVLHSSPILAAF